MGLPLAIAKQDFYKHAYSQHDSKISPLRKRPAGRLLTFFYIKASVESHATFKPLLPILLSRNSELAVRARHFPWEPNPTEPK